VAGKRAGDRDDRNLWPEFRRIVSELRPRWVVAENVPGLLSFSGGTFFASILDDLGELGFDGVAFAILDAQHFGVPQRRRRVFIVAGPSRRAVEQVLAICEGCGGHHPPGREAGEEATGGAEARAGGDSGAIAIRTAQTSSNGWGVGTDEQAYTLDGAQGQAVANPLGTAQRDDLDNSTYVPTQDVAYALAARNAKGVSLLESQDNFAVAATNVRRLTPIECERLQGWPDDHTRWDADGKEISDSHRYRMIGNGVVAPVAEWVGRRLVAVDEGPLAIRKVKK
jgi:DNA (cytosine-5)-methyltransferase 1